MSTPAPIDALATDIGWAALGSTLSERYTYAQLESYYRGGQPLSFLPRAAALALNGRLRSVVLNWPRLVVDSLEERLDVEGFRLADDEKANDDLWGIWQANRLDQQSQQCHLEALLHGRCYVLVWANDEDPSTPRISVESSQWMSVAYDPNGDVTQAVKRWVSSDTSYATVYYPDRVERYISADGIVIPRDVAITEAGWALREDPIGHDMGRVPVVPFVNRPTLARPFGESEITDIIPLADAVNKLATDMMVSAEYHAMPRRWATGVLPPNANAQQAEHVREEAREKWSKAEKDRAWLGPTGATFGQFPEATLDNFVRGIEMLASQASALSGLPPQEMGLNSQGNPASADAIRASESAKVKRAQRKQRVFGESWEDVMRLALLTRDLTLPDGAARMETIWRDPNTPTIAEKVDAATKLNSMGMPFRQSLEDIGYTPTATERIVTMQSTDSLRRVAEQMKAADDIVTTYGVSRAAALAAVGLLEAAGFEAKVESRQPPVAAELGGGDLGEAAPVGTPVPAAH